MRKLVLLTAILASGLAFADDVEKSDNGIDTNVHNAGGILDVSHHDRKSMLSFFAGVPFSYGFGLGVGARYYLPLVHDGFIPSLNDSFGIEFGVDVTAGFYGYFVPWFNIPAEATWTFHIFPKFAAYGKLGVALEIWPTAYCRATLFGCGAVGVNAVGGAGILWQITDTIVFRAETGYPWLKVGIGILL